MTTASLVGKYRKNVLGETSAASAICSTVVVANPRSANSRSASDRIVARVRAFFRSRSPIAAGGAPARAAFSAADDVMLRFSAEPGRLPNRLRLGRPVRQEQDAEDQAEQRDPGRADQHHVQPVHERVADRV